jgi:hypothetical protein
MQAKVAFARRELDLYQLWAVVQQYGGSEQVALLRAAD